MSPKCARIYGATPNGDGSADMRSPDDSALASLRAQLPAVPWPQVTGTAPQEWARRVIAKLRGDGGRVLARVIEPLRTAVERMTFRRRPGYAVERASHLKRRAATPNCTMATPDAGTWEEERASVYATSALRIELSR